PPHREEHASLRGALRDPSRDGSLPRRRAGGRALHPGGDAVRAERRARGRRSPWPPRRGSAGRRPGDQRRGSPCARSGRGPCARGGRPMSLLAHTVWGKGSPLLLIHGFTGNREAWSHLQPLLGDRYRVLAPDLPGHGESPLTPDTTFHGTVEQLLELLDATRLERADATGHSPAPPA